MTGRTEMKNILIHSIILIGMLCSMPVQAAEECDSIARVIQMESQVATASTFANWMRREGSIRFESRRMFEEAKAHYRSGDMPVNFCPENCQVARAPKLIFTSVPNKFKTEYGDAEKCEAYLKKTRSEPLTYTQILEPEVDALADWIGDFSQGDGDEGEKMYEDCDGSCSPQFSYDIRLRRDKLEVTADVVCGPARDKDDNTYTIAYSFIWSCEPAAAG